MDKEKAEVFARHLLNVFIPFSAATQEENEEEKYDEEQEEQIKTLKVSQFKDIIRTKLNTKESLGVDIGSQRATRV